MKQKNLWLTVGSLVLVGGAALALRQDKMPPPAKPSPEHAQVMKLVGTWDVTVKTGDKMEPGKSTITFEPVGDLWVSGQWKGTYMGEPFEGHSIQGYSQAKKKMVGVWVDSRMSDMSLAEGTWDAGSKTMKMLHQCPMNPAQPPSNETVVFKDDDHFTSTMAMKGPDGKDMPAMVFEYTRAKGASARGM